MILVVVALAGIFAFGWPSWVVAVAAIVWLVGWARDPERY